MIKCLQTPKAEGDDAVLPSVGKLTQQEDEVGLSTLLWVF
jgi:hypothetical protein